MSETNPNDEQRTASTTPDLGADALGSTDFDHPGDYEQHVAGCSVQLAVPVVVDATNSSDEQHAAAREQIRDILGATDIKITSLSIHNTAPADQSPFVDD